MADPSHRRLAAVLFSDIVGYSAQVSDDEAAALSRLEIHNRIFRTAIAERDGRVIKTIGDAFMVEFSSAVDAVACGLAVQQLLEDHNVAAQDDDRIDVRIGVHVGDVVERDGDLFGETVNVAARLEAAAPIGAVCVSRTVYAQLHRQVEADCEELGEKRFKGIERPVDAFALRPSDTRLNTRLTDRPPAPAKREPDGSRSGKYLLIAAAVVVGVALLYLKSIEAPPQAPSASASASAGAAAPPSDSELRVAGYGPRGIFDYYYSVPTLTAAALLQIAEPLVRTSPEGEPTAGVIASWESSEDGRSVDLRLADGVLFHAHRCTDNKVIPADSNDVAYSIEMAALHDKTNLPLLGRKPGRRETKGTQWVTEKILRLKFDQPVALPARELSKVLLLPKGFGQCENVRDAYRPIGTGPFVFAGGEDGEVLLLGRNERYWDEANPARVTRLQFSALDDPVEAIRRLAADELDVFGGIMPERTVPIHRGKGGLRLHDRYADAGLLVGLRPLNQWSLYALVFLHHKPKLAASAEVRRAIGSVLDRTALCELSKSVRQPTARIVGSDLLGYDAATEPPRFDDAEAKQALSMTKHAHILSIGAGARSRKVAEAIGDQLKKLDIEVRIVGTGSALAKLVEEGGVDAMLVNVRAHLFGNELYATGVVSMLKRVGFEDDKLSELLHAVQAERSRTARAKLLSELEKRLLETAPMIPICTRKQSAVSEVFIASPRVKNFIDPLTRRVIEHAPPFANVRVQR